MVGCHHLGIRAARRTRSSTWSSCHGHRTPLIVTLTPGIWRFFGLFVTFVHELGHAFAALTTGRVVKGISLNFDHSGQMNSFGRVGFSATWSGFWGYPAPGVLGFVLITSAVFTGGPRWRCRSARSFCSSPSFSSGTSREPIIAVITAIAAQLVVVVLPLEWIAVFVAATRNSPGHRLAQGPRQDDPRPHPTPTRPAVRRFILSQGSSDCRQVIWLTLFTLVIVVCALTSAYILYTAATSRCNRSSGR